jgi:ABC-type multidrug transport system fused ATPase/permease subunit
MKIGQKEVLKFFWKVTMKQKKLFFLSVSFIIVATISSLFLPIYIAKIIDTVSTYVE